MPPPSSREHRPDGRLASPGWRQSSRDCTPTYLLGAVDRSTALASQRGCAPDCKRLVTRPQQRIWIGCGTICTCCREHRETLPYPASSRTRPPIVPSGNRCRPSWTRVTPGVRERSPPRPAPAKGRKSAHVHTGVVRHSRACRGISNPRLPTRAATSDDSFKIPPVSLRARSFLAPQEVSARAQMTMGESEDKERGGWKTTTATGNGAVFLAPPKRSRPFRNLISTPHRGR